MKNQTFGTIMNGMPIGAIRDIVSHTFRFSQLMSLAYEKKATKTVGAVQNSFPTRKIRAEKF